MMNKVFLIGRLTRDPELRYTGSNKAVCQITVAVNRGFGGQNSNAETDFINVVLWDKTAENVAKYMTKGRLLLVEGRIQTRNYDNNEGKRVYVTEVVANNVQFLDSKSSTNGTNFNNVGNENNQMNNPSPFDFETGTTNQSMETVSVDNDPFASFGEKIDISDNDLPF